MIPFRNDISACDHCGVCCRTSPCLLGSPRDARKLSRFLGYDVRQHLSIEKVEGGHQVRISPPGRPCVLFKNERCSVHAVKPRGGREFKCWDRETFDRTYVWSSDQLAEIGFAA